MLTFVIWPKTIVTENVCLAEIQMYAYSYPLLSALRSFSINRFCNGTLNRDTGKFDFLDSFPGGNGDIVFFDFAGSGAVHMLGGFGGLVLALICKYDLFKRGKRIEQVCGCIWPSARSVAVTLFANGARCSLVIILCCVEEGAGEACCPQLARGVWTTLMHTSDAEVIDSRLSEYYTGGVFFHFALMPLFWVLFLVGAMFSILLAYLSWVFRFLMYSTVMWCKAASSRRNS